jgi:hypothetical protein
MASSFFPILFKKKSAELLFDSQNSESALQNSSFALRNSKYAFHDKIGGCILVPGGIPLDRRVLGYNYPGRRWEFFSSTVTAGGL